MSKARDFVEGENETFDMKVKILELIEVIKKEKSLRIMAERSNNQSKQKLQELTTTVEILQSQIDLANTPNVTFKSPRNNNNNNPLTSSDTLMISQAIKKKKFPSKKKITRKKRREKDEGEFIEPTFQDKAFMRRSRSFDNLNNTSFENFYLSQKSRPTRKLKRQKSKDKEKINRDNNVNNSNITPEDFKKTKRKLTKTIMKLESMEETIARLTKENITLHTTILKQKDVRCNLLDQITALGRENRKLEEQLKVLQKN